MQRRQHVPIPVVGKEEWGSVGGAEEGEGVQRRHAGSSAIDWPTGVSKHCRSRPPITQRTLSSGEMCPSGSHRRN